MDFWRQLDLVTPDDLAFPITVIGAGGIGSLTTLALAKMGVSDILIFDDDLIENHNLPNQFFRLRDVGTPKVEALQEIIEAFTGLQITIRQERFKDRDQIRQGVVVGAVDTMESRQKIWLAVRYNPLVELFVDARMGAEVCRIYTIQVCNPADVSFYEGTLYSDEEAAPVPCTARAIIYNVFLIASLIANQIKKFARAEPLAREIIFDLKTLTLIVNK